MLERLVITVKTTIYNGLRYGTDKKGNVVDGELYTSLYNGTASQNFEKNLDSTYNVVVNSILSSAANEKAGEFDSDTLALKIKQMYKKQVMFMLMLLMQQHKMEL